MRSKEFDKSSVSSALSKFGLLTDDIRTINIHLGILDCGIETLALRLRKNGFMTFDENTDEKQMAETIAGLIMKCDSENPEFNRNLDDEMVRTGLWLEEKSPAKYEDSASVDFTAPIDAMIDNGTLDPDKMSRYYNGLK